jgi:DNA-binding PadR family transcriptional regulator
MSEIRDKRRRTDLDLFVLALIDSGISTPYELQKAAGLSPGATIPALQRLLETGCVRQGKPGPRGRTDHKITPAGKKLLKHAWRALLDDGPSGDLDADLRVALLTLSAGGERRLAVDFLRQSSDKKVAAMETVAEDSTSDADAPLAIWYSRLRSAAAKSLLKGESVAVLAMAEHLPRKLSRKPAQSIRTTRQKDA